MQSKPILIPEHRSSDYRVSVQCAELDGSSEANIQLSHRAPNAGRPEILRTILRSCEFVTRLPVGEIQFFFSPGDLVDRTDIRVENIRGGDVLGVLYETTRTIRAREQRFEALAVRRAVFEENRAAMQLVQARLAEMQADLAREKQALNLAESEFRSRLSAHN